MLENYITDCQPTHYHRREETDQLGGYVEKYFRTGFLSACKKMFKTQDRFVPTVKQKDGAIGVLHTSSGAYLIEDESPDGTQHTIPLKEKSMSARVLAKKIHGR